MRSASGVGVGNLSDLGELARRAGEAGAAFVGINPLHALRNRGADVSPYQPVSRLFRNPLYLDATAVPEFTSCPEAQAQLASPEVRRELEVLRAARDIDYDRVESLLRRLLEALHARFLAGQRAGDSARGRQFRAWCSRQGDLLRDFATFRALEEHLAAAGWPRDWRGWPAGYREPRSRSVREFAEAHAREIDYHAFLQFELECQLERASQRARAAGLAIGLYQDLALGSAVSGFDTWAFRELFALDATVGAPPDAYAAEGQDWGFPPLRPERLADGDFRYFRLLLRAGFAHAGALRIDHALGLFRQFWIPAGGRPAQGSYVSYPAEELLGVLADESRRADALVVGEDLGTPAPGVPAALARHGVLSTQVLFFERTDSGGFHPASHYSKRALVTATTHDMHTLAAFWRGSDLELRLELGLLQDDAQLAGAREARARERRALLRRLETEGLLFSGGEPVPYPELCRAVNAFLCRTPAPLVALSLDDLAGETRPVNVPGLPPERFSSWTARMDASLEALAEHPDFRRALAGAALRAGSW